MDNMSHCRKMLAAFLLVVIVFSISVQISKATVATFTVKGGQEVTKPLNLAVEDHVVIKLTVVGSSDSSLYFSLACPNGTLENFGKVGYTTYSFVCADAGDYTLRFSNTESSEDKLVTLDYEVEHYILGIPQMLFLTLIIVGVCVAAVAVFILMGKPR